MPYDVFISYSSSDIKYAQELNDLLVNEEFKVWFDKTRLVPGFDWYKEIAQGCENSRVVLPVLTPRWKISDWTKYETYGAEAVIPVLYEGSWDEVTTPPLEQFQAEIIDMQNPSGPNWRQLISDIKRVRDSQLPQKTEHLTHIHYRANEYFTGREEDLIKIHEELHIKPRPGLTSGRVRAITAMGGAGKTTLVRQYVEKFWRCYSQIFWVDCRCDIEKEFANIHDILFPERKNIGLKDNDKAISALHELSNDLTRLLILDNADGLEESVINWIPQTGACHTLITSRYGAFGAAIKTIHIFVLEKRSSVEFFKKRTGRIIEGNELIACESLAEELKYLPLALEQSAAYIEQQGQEFSFDDYLILYKESRKDLLSIQVLGSTMYPDSVMTTWKSSISKLSPIGRAILHLTSYLACIPLFVEDILSVSDIIVEHAKRFYNGVGSDKNIGKSFWLRKELAQLKAYSMIEYDGHTFSMHPLLQIVERVSDCPEEINLTWNQSANILSRISPPASWADDCRSRWSLSNDKMWSQIMTHANNLEELRKENVDFINASYSFRYLFINAFASKNLISRALELCQDLIKSIEENSDVDKLFILKVNETIAYLYKQDSKYEEALKCFRSLSEAYSKFCEDLNPIILRMKHNIACVLVRLSKYEEAESIMLDVLEKRKKVLGESNYDTITSIHDYGWLLSYSETKWEDAEPLYRLAYEQWSATLGLNNPDTRTAAQNLARLLNQKGDFLQAEQIQRDLLTGTEAILSKDHIECYGLKHNLSLFLYNNRKYEEAYQMINEVVNGYRKYLPPDHRNMLTALQDLGTILGNLGKNTEAENYLKEALAGYEKTQKPDSADTLRTVSNLAYLYDKLGKKEEAKKYHQRIIHSKLSNDQVTAFELRELAANCFSIGDYILAESLLLRVLSENFELASTYCNLARLCLITDRLQDVNEYIEKAVLNRENAKLYVHTRISLLKIILQLLNNSKINDQLSTLKSILRDDKAFNHWEIQPVIEHIKSKITENQHTLLTALVAALCDQQNVEKLNDFPEWRDAKEENLE